LFCFAVVDDLYASSLQTSQWFVDRKIDGIIFVSSFASNETILIQTLRRYEEAILMAMSIQLSQLKQQLQQLQQQQQQSSHGSASGSSLLHSLFHHHPKQPQPQQQQQQNHSIQQFSNSQLNLQGMLQKQHFSNVPFVLAVNKADLPESKYTLGFDSICKHAILEYRVGSVMAVSAKTGLGISEMFDNILRQVMKRKYFLESKTGKKKCHIQ